MDSLNKYIVVKSLNISSLKCNASQIQSTLNRCLQPSGKEKMPDSNRLPFKLMMAFDRQTDIEHFNPSSCTNRFAGKFLLVLKIRN